MKVRSKRSPVSKPRVATSGRVGLESRPSAAAELLALAKYFDRTVEWKFAGPKPSRGPLVDVIDYGAKLVADGLDELRDLLGENAARSLIVADCRQCDDAAIEQLLSDVRPLVARTTRVALVGREPVGCARPLAGWQTVRVRRAGFTSKRLGGVGELANRVLPAVPVVRRLAACSVSLLRPVVGEPRGCRPSLSIIVPARNERGNIAQVMRRLPDFEGAQIEVIFVEGNSTDGTWEEIERVVAAHARPDRQDAFPHSGHHAKTEGSCAPHVQALRQSGRGKADAVRLGIARASGDLIAILDADLTMPPESLIDFYRAYCDGRGDFINGDRLSLPMERGAMRPLNKQGNRFFAWALSHVLDTPLADCLCGTKLFARHDYERFVAWRNDFGDRDPFGDFELLFPAAVLGLGITNLPIRYAARTYGQTNIRRFRDGARLMAMTLAGWRNIRMGRV